MSRGKRTGNRSPQAQPQAQPQPQSAQVNTIEREQPKKEGGRMVMSASFEGPLPPPGVLASYDDVVPGLASRIAGWTTDQTDHRQSMESRAIGIDEKLSTWYIVETLLGQIFAFLIAISVLVSCVYLGLHDKEAVAIALGTIGFGGMVAAFITGKKIRTSSEARQSKSKK